MTIHRNSKIVHHGTVRQSGTTVLAHQQPESLMDFSIANDSGVRFHLDVHGTTGTFESWELRARFKLGMMDVDGAGDSMQRWYDLQPEQVKTLIQEGVDWYGGTVQPSKVTNLMTNPSWELNGTGALDIAGTGGAVEPSRPVNGGFLGTTRRRITWTAGTTAPSGGIVLGDATVKVTAGKTYTAAVRFAPSRSQRLRPGIRWYNDTSPTALATDYGVSQNYPATDIQHAHRAVVTATAPAGATTARIYLYVPEGDGAVNWEAGNTLDVDAGLLVEGTFVPPDFDGDSPGAVWNGTPHASTSTLTLPPADNNNVVATSRDTLPVTVSRAIKGFGQLVAVEIKPTFVKGSEDAGITYSLNASY